MKSFREFKDKIRFVLTDIDDTLTLDGKLPAGAYQALWHLKDHGVHVIPITGRPAGWCEMIARLWPVEGIVGENGAFYFRYKNKKMLRTFAIDLAERESNETKLNAIRDEILAQIPGTAVASDQFCRINDLAIDFCEDVPALPAADVKKIVSVFQKHGATAKVSSIHVNGWFGKCDKLSTSLLLLKNEFGLSDSEILKQCAFVGDSPNDEPMFSHFPFSFGVANIRHFISELSRPPVFVSDSEGGSGFEEIASQIIRNG
ncbi:MAG: HAD-IIB family hydrolase [Bdellovibrionota bacterium]